MLSTSHLRQNISLGGGEGKGEKGLLLGYKLGGGGKIWTYQKVCICTYYRKNSPDWIQLFKNISQFQSAVA